MRDRQQHCVTKGKKALQQATMFDKAGRWAEAQECYRKALLQFKNSISKANGGPNPIFPAEIRTNIEQCERRYKELNQMPAALPNARGIHRDAPGHGQPPSHPDQDVAIVAARPNIHWSDIAGLREAKRDLAQAVIGPQTPWHGILLYGPPGTGKSFLAKACATETDGSPFITVSKSDLFSEWLGESSKLMPPLFEEIWRQKRAIIFIDEIDSLLPERNANESESLRRIKVNFLNQMDRVRQGIVLGTTNSPWSLDPAVHRYFEKKIYIPLPDFEARLFLLKGKSSTLTDENYQDLATMTEGYSGADIKCLCMDAFMVSVSKSQMAVTDPTIADFYESLEKVRPSVSKSDLDRFEKWTQEFGQAETKGAC